MTRSHNNRNELDTNDDESNVINDDGQAKKLGLGLLLKLQWEWRTIFQASMAPNYSALK